jgi:hypothetical protein
LGGIRGFFILTRDLEKKRKFFSLVLGKIREVSLPFVVDGSDIALSLMENFDRATPPSPQSHERGGLSTP